MEGSSNNANKDNPSKNKIELAFPNMSKKKISELISKAFSDRVRIQRLLNSLKDIVNLIYCRKTCTL